MNIINSISESAFLVNESRKRRIDISGDIYANLWTTDSTRDLWDDFSKKVYKYDDIEISLRNRFFLDNINLFLSSTSKSVFINIGAGFTSYPFLISKPCRCIEVDLPSVIDFKKNKIQLFVKDKKLPDSDIEFISADVCKKADVEYLQDTLSPIINKNISFILLEGITYFLDKSVLNHLIDMFLSIQTNDSILAFDFWKPDIVSNPVFKKLINYFNERFGFNTPQYNLFDKDFLKSIKGYSISEITNIQRLEQKYLNTNVLQDYNKILPENYIILRRLKSNK